MKSLIEILKASMAPTLATIVVGLLCSVAIAQTDSNKFDRKSWISDYDALRTHLEGSYANLLWFASPESGINLPNLHLRTLRALKASRDNSEAAAAVDAFISGFHDGHLAKMALGAPKAELGAKKEAFRPDFSVPPRDACAALGYVHKKGTSFSVPFEATPGFRLLNTGENEAFRSGVAKLPDGRALGVVRISVFDPHELPAECEKAWAEFKKEKNAKSCDKDCVHDLQDRVMSLFLESLSLRLKKFTNEKVDAVLLDLGGNGGGDDLGDWVPRLFTKNPMRSPLLGTVKDPKSITYFEEQLKGIRTALLTEKLEKARLVLSNAEKEYINLKENLEKSKSCDISWVWKEQRKWSPLNAKCTNLNFGKTYSSGFFDYLPAGQIGSESAEEQVYWPALANRFIGSWQGPVYVAIDGRTASAAELTAAIFQDNKVAKIMGTNSLGCGCGAMFEGSNFTLPKHQIRYKFPNCVRLRADSSDEVQGIQPNILVPSIEGESDAERAGRFVKLIGENLSSSVSTSKESL
jgi:hypothetical protein